MQVACPKGEALAEGSEAFKTYKNQYKRLCTHFRRNPSLVKRISAGNLDAEKLAAMEDRELMAEEQKHDLEQFRQEGLQEALGMVAEDSAHWTPSDNYTCPRCECVKCIYIQTFNGAHGYDDNNKEPAITIRCTSCKHLWKEEEVEGGRSAAGAFSIEQPDSSAPYASSRRQAEAPALWHETAGRKEPTWLLPAKD